MKVQTALAAALLAGALPLSATQVKIFETQSQAGFLAGKLAGVSVDVLGRMSLAPRTVRLASISEPFLLSAAVAPHGWVVGTGNAGKVLVIGAGGEVRELLAAAEPEVFALLVDPDGTVYAGSSPHGKVYRVTPDGKSSVFFDPGETYIWALARDADGELLVATGTQGKLFRVDAKGHGTVRFKSEDTHLRSLLPLPGGDLLMGTAGEGLILKLGKDGKVSTLFDAEEPEVVALTAAPDGTCYAAVDASEASLLDLPKEAAAPAAGGGLALNAPGGTGARSPLGRAATAAAQEAAGEVVAAGSRRPGASGPRSELLRISPQGTVESLWSFGSETVYSLLWQDGRLWVATGLEGKLYSWSNANLELQKDVEERQIVALLPGRPGPAFATTNAAAFYRITAGVEENGAYTSAALDAGQAARFGTFRWRGEVPPGGALAFSFRTGFSAQPDRTWSSWTAPRPAGEASAGEPAAEGAAGPGAREPAHEVPLAELPRGRFVQWRAEIRAGAGAASPVIYGVELSYRQENLRPRITAFQALEPGQILVPANFNPGNQVYEPAHPARDGIFTSLEPAIVDDGGRLKPLWKKGYQTLRWTASDPNEEPLVYDLYFRPARAGRDGSPWIRMARGIEEDHYSFDAMALPDGVYRFRLIASDRNANDAATALSAERVSDPVVIDHTPPALVSVVRDGRLLRVKLHDDASPIREAVYSINGAVWKPARPVDGLLDGQTETVTVELPEPVAAGAAEAQDTEAAGGRRGRSTGGARGGDAAEAATGAAGPARPLVLLRVTDAAYNVISFDLSAQVP